MHKCLKASCEFGSVTKVTERLSFLLEVWGIEINDNLKNKYHGKLKF